MARSTLATPDAYTSMRTPSGSSDSWSASSYAARSSAKIDGVAGVVFEVTPSRVYGHAKGDPFGQTNYRF